LPTERIGAGDRLSCVVPFCRRTVAGSSLARGAEWICSEHWRSVSRRTKLIKRRAERHGRYRLARMAWVRCKAEAIEAAGGIG
jgi:hypothetical protein